MGDDLCMAQSSARTLHVIRLAPARAGSRPNFGARRSTRTACWPRRRASYESFQVVGGPPRSLSRWLRASHSSALRTRTTPSGESSILVSTSTQHLMRSTVPSAGTGTVQIRAVPSAEPVSAARPSERKAAEKTGPLWTNGGLMGLPVAGSQIRAVWSVKPTSKDLSSGLYATQEMRLWSISGGAAGWPVAGSQNRTALSQLPVATILPSCRKLALRTEP